MLVATVCTGSLLLAESGLLDGRSCAGHWAYADLFQTAYPRIRFLPGRDPRPLERAEGLITAGGVTSWQDLALHLIARFCGPEHAARTAKVYLLGGSRGRPAAVRRDDAARRDRRRGDPRRPAWIDDHYATPNPVSRWPSARA